MFAPRFGIQEESATGMAAGPLACYLYDVLGTPSTELNIEQGWLMEPPLPSVISVKLTVTNGTISTLMVGGRARVESLMEVSV
jgi:predicted PhzF superfamily epimerase YddE/YHI9